MKRYKKEDEHSYTLGVFPTIELLKYKYDYVERVYIHSSIEKNSGYPLIKELCHKYNIEMIESDKTINKLSPKGNCFSIGVFRKYQGQISDSNHIVLVNPMDSGNLGTIMRTMLGFGYKDLIIIRPATDVFDPKTIRASMGALFHLNVHYYDDFITYYHEYSDHQCYPFMLEGASNIHSIKDISLHSLIFGNESSGLSIEYRDYGQSIFIPHENEIDSLNLSMAVGCALFYFSSNEFRQDESLRRV